MFYLPLKQGLTLREVQVDSSLESLLLPEERALIEDSKNTNRRLEFAAGRRAAHLALEELGVLGHSPILRHADSRAPLWPPGIVGSITHKQDRAIALLALESCTPALGIDLEQVGSVTPEVYKRIASEEEQAWIKSDSSESGFRATLIFSAKESVYKALYLYLEYSLQFLDATIRPASENSFQIELSPQVQRRMPSDQRLKLYHAQDAGLLLTACIIERIEPAYPHF